MDFAGTWMILDVFVKVASYVQSIIPDVFNKKVAVEILFISSIVAILFQSGVLEINGALWAW